MARMAIKIQDKVRTKMVRHPKPRPALPLSSSNKGQGRSSTSMPRSNLRYSPKTLYQVSFQMAPLLSLHPFLRFNRVKLQSREKVPRILRAQATLIQGRKSLVMRIPAVEQSNFSNRVQCETTNRQHRCS